MFLMPTSLLPYYPKWPMNTPRKCNVTPVACINTNILSKLLGTYYSTSGVILLFYNTL